MRIGELARRAGVNIDTVRYYERSGVLPVPARTASGYRDYDHGDLARLHFVRRAKRLGFTLAQAVELLALGNGPDADLAAVRSTATARLADVEARIAELAAMRDVLRTLVDACPGEGARDACPILHAFESDDSPTADLPP